MATAVDSSEDAGAEATRQGGEPEPVRREPASGSRLLLWVGLACVATNLGIRVLHRGSEMPAWDYLLTVQGEYLLATRGAWGALRETLVQVRTFWLPPAAYSVPYGLIPGALASWWPGLFWQPLVVFLAWMATLVLLVVASGWPLRSTRGWACALLAWGASPALLSYSVEGYPWGGGALPHALALALVLAPGWSWARTIPGLLIVWELPWHGYELGKTAGATLLLAALLAPDIRMARRLACIAVGAFQLHASWFIWPSHNIMAFHHGSAGAGPGILGVWADLGVGIRAVASFMWGTSPMLLPVLIVSGALALPWAGNRRLALAAAWATQIGLVLLLAASGPELLRARRFEIVEVLSIAAVLAAVRVGPVALRPTLLALLIAGNAWALIETARFVTAPPAPEGFSLPNVFSHEGVGMVDRPAIAWAEGLADRARRGERVVLLHSQGCPVESFTNPVGVLERLYLRIGHDGFREHVVAVAVAGPRYVTVPVVDLAEALDTLRPGQVVDMDTRCAPQMTQPLAALRARFELTPLTDERARFASYRLDLLRRGGPPEG